MSWDIDLQALTFARPEMLYLLSVAALVWLWSLVGARNLRGIIAPSLRALALAIIAAALAGPETIKHLPATTRPVAVDLSNSVTPAMRKWTLELLRQRLGAGVAGTAFAFAGRPLKQTVSDVLRQLDSRSGCAGCEPESTDLEAALRAVATDPASEGGPAVLVTDGWENHGEASRALDALQAAGLKLYVFTPPALGPIPDVALTALDVPSALPSAQPFALGVTVTNLNDTAVAGSLALYENGQLAERRNVNLAPGEQRFDFNLAPKGAGLFSYRAVFSPASAKFDIYPQNDSLEGWVGVGASRKVLILTDTGRDARYLENVAQHLGLETKVVALGTNQFDGSLKGYDAVMLNNVPSSRLSPRTQQEMAGYVRQGGTLAMVGGDQSFGLGGYQQSRLAEVLPVTMKPPEHKVTQRALVLIIDKSGSMGRNDKLVYAKAAARTVLSTLRDDDLVAVIGFDSQPFVLVPLEPLSQVRPYFTRVIDALKAQGTTFLMPALKEAERMLAGSGASAKHLVILTDGETGGTAAMYYDLVSTMHHEGGATVSSIAIGNHANIRLLEAISRYGGGGFYQTDSPQDLPQLFLQDVRQRQPSASMMEKEFVPRSVQPDPLLKEIAARQLPALKGYVRTQLKPGARLSLYVNREGKREPLVASWNYAAGKALAVTTDASGRWSGLWMSDGVFAPVWNKLLTWMTPKGHNAEQFAVAIGYQEGKLKVKLTDYSPAGGSTAQPINMLVNGPGGSKVQAAMTESARGELSATIDAPEPGTYNINLKSMGAESRAFPPLAFSVSPAARAELPRKTPNYDLLEELASATGGRLNPAPSELELRNTPVDRRTSLALLFLVPALILLIAEAFVRRLTL